MFRFDVLLEKHGCKVKFLFGNAPYFVLVFKHFNEKSGGGRSVVEVVKQLCFVDEQGAAYGAVEPGAVYA